MQGSPQARSPSKLILCEFLVDIKVSRFWTLPGYVRQVELGAGFECGVTLPFVAASLVFIVDLHISTNLLRLQITN